MTTPIEDLVKKVKNSLTSLEKKNKQRARRARIAVDAYLKNGNARKLTKLLKK